MSKTRYAISFISFVFFFSFVFFGFVIFRYYSLLLSLPTFWTFWSYSPRRKWIKFCATKYSIFEIDLTQPKKNKFISLCLFSIDVLLFSFRIGPRPGTRIFIQTLYQSFILQDFCCSLFLASDIVNVHWISELALQNGHFNFIIFNFDDTSQLLSQF